MRIAVLGAGLAGIACARRLVAAGCDVMLFDKGRAAGGRVTTRRADGFAFDHGAQYLRPSSDTFAAALRQAGAQPWPAAEGLVGVPSMSALPRALAAGLDLRAARHVVALRREAEGWTVLHHEASALRPGAPPPAEAPAADGGFDAVLSTLPAPQAAPLLRPIAPALAEAAAAVPFAPCWTLMAAFPDRLPLPDTLRPPAGPIGWAARDSAKPGRKIGAECWVVQAGPVWSRENLEVSAEAARDALLACLAALAGPLPPPRHASAHRWRYAVAERPLGRACLWDPALGLGLGGDWCLGDRAEAAWDSGMALAEALVGAAAHAG